MLAHLIKTQQAGPLSAYLSLILIKNVRRGSSELRTLNHLKHCIIIIIINKVSCNPSWSKTPYVAKDNSLASTSWVLGRQACTSTYGLWGAKDWSQGSAHAKQELYQLSHILSLYNIIFNLDAGSSRSLGNDARLRLKCGPYKSCQCRQLLCFPISKNSQEKIQGTCQVPSAPR